MNKERVDKVLKMIVNRIDKFPFLIAIDGRCCAGKTTLANELSVSSGYPVIHMDHFFLRPEQINEKRLSIPGENIDHERFLAEVMFPIKEGKIINYRPYNCHKKMFLDNIMIPISKVYIIEGSYALNTHLLQYYDLKIFIDISKDEQKRRLIRRNGLDGSKIFLEKWIPLEEKYFSYFQIKENCDLRI